MSRRSGRAGRLPCRSGTGAWFESVVSQSAGGLALLRRELILRAGTESSVRVGAVSSPDEHAGSPRRCGGWSLAGVVPLQPVTRSVIFLRDLPTRWFVNLRPRNGIGKLARLQHPGVVEAGAIDVNDGAIRRCAMLFIPRKSKGIRRGPAPSSRSHRGSS